MRLKSVISFFTLLALFHLSICIPVGAATYTVSDIALTPGENMAQLHIAWHHSDSECDCVVAIAKKPAKATDNHDELTGFPEDSYQFKGTNELIGLDEKSVVTYACEITVSGLENSTEYIYKLGNGRGDWSNTYKYATRDKDQYSFFYVADSQIGASGPKTRSQDIKAHIAEYQIRKRYPDLSDEHIKVLSDACTGNAPTTTLIGLTDLKEEIDLLHDIASKDTSDKLANLQSMDPVLAREILALQITAAEEDAKGWKKTVEIMTEKFPEAAFMLSVGDQVELKNREYEYTGFFSPSQLTSLPVAPAIGNHDSAVNFDYHFNLPNESSEHGLTKAGGDYYFTYGNVLFMVLNIDATTSTFPRQPPPGQGGSPQGGPSPPPGQNGGRQGGPSSPPGQDRGMAAHGAPPGGPSPPGPGTHIDSEEEFKIALSKLEQYCDKETGDCYDKLEEFKKSVAEHTAFMEDALAENPNARWKVVMWHDSIYSVGFHATDDSARALRHYLVPVLENLDIDLVLMGHDHSYTRTHQMMGNDPQPEQKTDKLGRIINPTGILYLTANSSSGSKYYELNRNYDVLDNPDTPEIEGPDPYFEYVSVAGQLKTPLFSYISIDQNSLEISTYTTDTMEMIDSYAIVKE